MKAPGKLRLRRYSQIDAAFENMSFAEGIRNNVQLSGTSEVRFCNRRDSLETSHFVSNLLDEFAVS